MRAHEAGALHGQSRQRPSWLASPADVNELVPRLWAESVTKNGNELEVGGLRASAIAAEVGTPAYVLDEQDFRSRARAFAEAFADDELPATVYYAGKAFLCRAAVQWIDAEGLGLDVCSGGELAVALSAGFPPARVTLHGNNKSDAELQRAVEVGVGRVAVDSVDDIDRLDRLAQEAGVQMPVLVRVTVGVEAHTHDYIATAHEDQKFGLSLADGHAADAARRVHAARGLRLLGLHSHIGSQIFDTSGFEVAARRVLGLHAQLSAELGAEMPELDLGGGFGIAYSTQDDPQTPDELAEGIRAIVGHECHALGIDVPHLSVEPGRAIAGPSTFTLYEVGTVKQVALDAGASRTYVSVDGGMSDNVRTALYGADYSCTLASRRSSAEPVLSRVVGKHCESGDIVVKDEYLPGDIRRGDLIAVPATGAYCRSLASTYNHVPRPPVVAVRDGAVRVLLRRETEDDLLRLDVG
ncbi:MAG: diaminopimelate decarboxylase [Nocardioidaceae bacterium]|nr:diaminopimelate decarboxylase [Nocardioidaceae bacterium]MDQ3325885.1 diaminopimelate decarboxylase [Actinomycetota bacterium]